MVSVPIPKTSTESEIQAEQKKRRKRASHARQACGARSLKMWAMYGMRSGKKRRVEK